MKVLRDLRLNIKATLVVLRLGRFTQGPISFRYKIMKKYFPFYIYHSKNQSESLASNLSHIKTFREQNNYSSQVRNWYKNYSQDLQKSLAEKKKEIKQKDKSDYEKQARNLLHSGMEYLSLYYESLQNLIQGRREVLHDQNFKFQDGETVEQKRVQFEKYFNRLIGRKKEQIQKLQEEYQMKKQSQRQKVDF